MISGDPWRKFRICTQPSTSDVSVAPLAAKHTEIFSTTSTKISFRLPPLALSRAVARTLRCVASRLAVPPGVCVGAAFAAAASFPYSIPAFTTPLKTPYGVEALLTAADALAAAAPAPVVADEAGAVSYTHLTLPTILRV